MSPSHRHELLARGLPLLRRTPPMRDAAQERASVERCHAGLDHELPATRVPGFGRRFRVTEESVEGPRGPFRSWVVTRHGTAPTRTLYYLHGGGFVSPADAWHVRYTTGLATRLGARVVLPDYPLAPEHDWRDSHEALAEDVQRYAARGPVVLGGDSAGGNIALALAQTLRDRGGSAPERLLLVSPWVDLSESTPATAALEGVDPWLSLPRLRTYAAWWSGAADPTASEPDELARAELSPALGDLDGLPPALMFCGTRDLLQPGCRLLAERARTADWSLTYVERPDLIHVYPILPGVPEARTARRQALAFLR